MAQLKTILFSFIRVFLSGEIARFVFYLGAKPFSQLRCPLRVVLPECTVAFLEPLIPFGIPSEIEAATQPTE
jgi:hypothetical protein